MLLIAGSTEDPQIMHLFARAQSRDCETVLLATGNGDADVNWYLQDEKFRIGYREINPKAAFIRQDVFRHLRTGDDQDRQNARAWKVFLDGYLWAREEIRLFNRDFLMRSDVNKPLALYWAAQAGLAIPDTRMHVSRARALAQLDETASVYKPVGGGGYCRELTREVLEQFPSDSLGRPYIYQERLVAPEIRIFRVGKDFVAFDVASDDLDYRTGESGQPKLTRIDPPQHLLKPLTQVLDRLGLDFSAADFKTSQHTGELCFLEANSNPMFAAFDKAADYALTDRMLDWLLQPE